MKFKKLKRCVELIGNELAEIQHVADPSITFLAAVDCCENGAIYVVWVKKNGLSIISEALTRCSAENILSLEPSGISSDSIVVDDSDRDAFYSDNSIWPKL